MPVTKTADNGAGVAVAVRQTTLEVCMTEFYCPATKTVTLPNGRLFQVRKGIHAIPDDLASSKLANDLGIKPIGEMTEAEWTATAFTAARRAEIMDRHGLVEKPQTTDSVEAE